MPDPSIEIVNSLFQPVQNPHEDRITAILQKRAQPQNYSLDQIYSAGSAAQNFALAGRSGNGVEQILDAIIRQPQREQQNMELESAQGLYNMFEQKRASGDKQAQALFDRISLFTGGDPEGTAMFINELHSDPDPIDPSNAFQVMTKLAGVAKRTGYVSPESQLKKLQLQKARADLVPKENDIDTFDEYSALTPEQKALFNEYKGLGKSSSLPSSYEEFSLSQNNPDYADFLKQKKEKPMPATALKLQNESLDIIGTASSMNDRLGKVINKIDDKKLQVGPLQNVISSGRNLAGISNENSRNFASFKSDLEKLRNDSLRLNKGVQTEGDAVRAWNEILANLNDEELISQRLKEVQAINKRAAELQKLNVDNIRANYGNDPLDFSKYENPIATPADDDSDLFEYMTPQERALFGK